MDGKLKVGDLCKSLGANNMYLVLACDEVKPTSVMVISVGSFRDYPVGAIITAEDNGWRLVKVADSITELEKVIYGVTHDCR